MPATGSAARPRSGPPTWPPPGRRRRARCARRRPPAPPARRSRRAGRCRRCRPGRKGYSAVPTRTLCPTWTRLSILVPAPIRVSPRVARSIVDVGPHLDVRLDDHPPDLRHLVVDAAVGGVAEAVGCPAPRRRGRCSPPRPRCRRRARRADGAPPPPPPRSRGRPRRRRRGPRRRRPIRLPAPITA